MFIKSVRSCCLTQVNLSPIKPGQFTTHSDEVSLYKKDRDKFENKIENHSLVLESQLILGGKNKVQLLIGSLDSTENGKSLLKQIFINL